MSEPKVFENPFSGDIAVEKGKVALKKEVNESFWNVEPEQSITDFFKWGVIDTIYVQLEDKIQNYEIYEFEGGEYGLASYIRVKMSYSTDKEAKYLLLKIQSKRLKKALVEVSNSVKKFPVHVKIQREGEGYNTTYKAEIILPKVK
jgi:hypothetical protein